MPNKEFANFIKMVAEETKKSSAEISSTNIQETVVQQTPINKSLPLEVSNYLSKQKIIKEDIRTKHDELVSISTDADNRPASPENIEQQRWNDPLRPLDQNFVTFKQMNDHYSLFLNRIQQQMASIGGGGEVRLARLDDVDASTIGPNRHLAYNSTTKKFFFEDVSSGSDLLGDGNTTTIIDNIISVINLPEETPIGPIEQLSFNLNHTHQEERTEGTLCWDPDDRTLNLTSPGDVTQKVGQDLYAKVRNATGTVIVKGQAVRFAGASVNGETARLEVTPFLADGSFPSLFGFGILAQTVNDGNDGLIIVWGKLRDIDTTGNGENWQIGDILYVSPNVAGGLTKVKPTAPNNVIPIAAVLRVDETKGEIFVRPTIEQDKNYGKFSRTTDLNVATINTAATIGFDETEIARGVAIDLSNPSRMLISQSGLYQVDVSAQVDATGGGFSSGTMFMWIRKNGVNVPDSTRRQGVLGAAPSSNIGFTVVLSLDANDYIEIGYAGDSTNLRFDAAAATAFAPSTSSVKVSVAQIQL
jgi:hypothetical protein